jgi:hypothetical protein
MGTKVKTTRFSGAEWAEEIRDITLIGAGGIGSWVALNLSRIGHNIMIFDGDNVDETNVIGGQLYRRKDIGDPKVTAIFHLCNELGGTSHINAISSMFEEEDGLYPITITGLDNMKARKLVFDEWVSEYGQNPDALLIDGRLLMENMEVLTIQGGNKRQIDVYKQEYLFDDSEVADLDCTTKQSTFSAMGIACLITTTLCNFLTNRKLGVQMREVPFHQTFFLPIFKQNIENLEDYPETTNKKQEELKLEVI